MHVNNCMYKTCMTSDAGRLPLHAVVKGALSPALPHGQYPRPGYWPKKIWQTRPAPRMQGIAHKSGAL